VMEVERQSGLRVDFWLLQSGMMVLGAR
jgi:hypothetical protein